MDAAVSPFHDSGDDSRDNTRLPDSIDVFLTNHQPILDTVLKEMLVSLRSSLHLDMVSCVHKFSMDLKSISDRVTHVESKMGEYAVTINDLVDANYSRDDEIESIKAKMVDMEDRIRRNNIKIRGIPESVQQHVQLLNAILPDMSAK